MAIEPGTVVVLKSGSPLMTVEEFGDHKDAKCTWFQDKHVRREWFTLTALREAPTATKSKVAK